MCTGHFTKFLAFESFFRKAEHVLYCHVNIVFESRKLLKVLRTHTKINLLER